MRDQADFLVVDKHQCFLQGGTIAYGECDQV